MTKGKPEHVDSIGNSPQTGSIQGRKLDVVSISGQVSPLSADELAACVSRILAYGTVRESYHSREERSGRNISDDDLQHGLSLSWILAKEPNWDSYHRNWEYLIRTKDIEGDELHIKIVAEPEFNRIRIITKY